MEKKSGTISAFIHTTYFFQKKKCSETVNLPFNLEVKLSVEPKSQSSEFDLLTLLQLWLIVALSHKSLFTISVFDFFFRIRITIYIIYNSCVIKYCKKIKTKITEPLLFGWSLLPFR